MSSNEIVIDVGNLSKRYEIYNSPHDRLKQFVLPRLQRLANRASVALGASKFRQTPDYFCEFWALKDISFQVRRGETLGIIGRNGSGKSTLLQILAGTLFQTSGDVTINGRIAALLELGSGFNPEFSGRDNIFLNGRILGLSQKEIESRYGQIVDFADIGDFIDQPVKTYSSGMFVRLAFAVQAHVDASIVIIDEALAVGDIFFRQKCYARLEQLSTSGAAIIVVSHAMTEIEQFCNRAILLDHGTAKFIGSSSEAAKHYYLLHQTQKVGGGDNPCVRQKSPQILSKNSSHVEVPDKEAFLDLTQKTQISNGQAHCIGVALCNEDMQPCNRFSQGDRGVFFSEFLLSEKIGVPICGMAISNDRGIIVHGKNSWQYDEKVSESGGEGSRVVCRQEIDLDLGPGEYVFEVGLSCVSTIVWQKKHHISHEKMSSSEVRVCHIANVGSFSVGFMQKHGTNVLKHHGVADLPGKLLISIVD